MNFLSKDKSNNYYFFTFKAGKDIQASMANPDDFDAIVHGKKHNGWLDGKKADDAKEEPTINYDTTEAHFISIDDGMKDYFECEKCGDLHGQGEQCDNDAEITKSPHPEFTIIPNPEPTSSNVREKTYMSDSEGDSDDEETDIVIDDNVVFVEELSE